MHERDDRSDIERGEIDRGEIDRGDIERGEIDRGELDRGELDRGDIVARGERDRSDERRDFVWTVNVIAAGLAIVFAYAFPGLMAYDSYDQLAQARAGELTDWHPPLMSALWGVLDHIIAGPLLMLILQCSLFVGGLYVLLRRRFARRFAAIATLVITALPPNLSMMAVILKDSLFAGALLAGLAALTSSRPRVRAASLVAFGFAGGLRYNAAALVVPLVALLSPWPARRGPWLRAAAGTGLVMAAIAVAWLGNRALTDTPTHPFPRSVATLDIVGTLAYAPPLDDAEIVEILDGAPLPNHRDIQRRAAALYDPTAYWGALFVGPDRFVDDPQTPEQRAAIVHGWWRVVRAEPGAYLASRADKMRVTLGFTERRFDAVYTLRHEDNMYKAQGLPPREHPEYQRPLQRAMQWLGDRSLIFRPYVYMLLALVLAITQRRDRLVLALVAGAFANTALLFFVAPAPDFRYVHWWFVAVPIGLAIRFGELACRSRSRASYSRSDDSRGGSAGRDPDEPG